MKTKAINALIKFAFLYQVLAFLFLLGIEGYMWGLLLQNSLPLKLEARFYFLLLMLTYLSLAKVYWDIYRGPTPTGSLLPKLGERYIWGRIAIVSVVLHYISTFFYHGHSLPTPESVLIGQSEVGEFYKMWFSAVPYLDRFFISISSTANIFFVILLYLLVSRSKSGAGIYEENRL